MVNPFKPSVFRNWRGLGKTGVILAQPVAIAKFPVSARPGKVVIMKNDARAAR